MNKLIYCTLAVMMMMILSCGSEKSDPSPDVQALLTSGTWKIKTVTVDGVNKNDLFTNFTVSFSGTGFTAVNGAPVWPNSGTWSFATSDKKTFIRSDDVEVTLVSISESEMTLKLMWDETTLGSGRAVSIEGNHTFLFSK